MRPSPKLHVLVILREKLGLQQKQMAALLKMPVELYKNLELTRKKMTKEIAHSISFALGVETTWLMNNDQSVPPVTSFRQEFTKETYEFFRAAEDGEVDPVLIDWTTNQLLESYMELRLIFGSASSQGISTWHRVHDRLRGYVAALREEFGEVYPLKTDPAKSTLPLGTLTPGMLSFIEHDLEAAREVFLWRKVELKPAPTPHSMARYRAKKRRLAM